MSGSLAYAIQGQEGSGPEDVSPRGAVGRMQVTRPFFDTFAAPGEEFNNEADRRAVAQRGLRYYQAKYQDPARVAVAYFSGPANVAPPGSPVPWIKNVNDGTTSVAQYVNGVMGRLGMRQRYDPNHPQVSREEDAAILTGGREQGEDTDLNMTPQPDSLHQRDWYEYREDPANWMPVPIPTQSPAGMTGQGLPPGPGMRKAFATPYLNNLTRVLKQSYPRPPWRT